MIYQSKAVGMQFMKNWRTYALLATNGQIAVYQYAEKPQNSVLTEGLALPTLEADSKEAINLCRPVSLSYRIDGDCHALPFYCETFPYVLAPDQYGLVSLINTKTGKRLGLIRLRKMHRFD